MPTVRPQSSHHAELGPGVPYSHRSSARRLRAALAAILVLTLIVLTLIVLTGGQALAHRTMPAAPAATRSTGTILGAYVGGGDTERAIKASIQKLEAGIGRKLGLDQHFYHWDSVFPTWQEPWDVVNGRLPMLSWGHFYTSKINSGSQDALIRARAIGLKALQSKVLLRWFPEMDGVPWKQELGSASAFISAWRHIYKLFKAQGATNVKFVWCPNAFNFSTGVAQSLYPGNAYVDWICADSFNWSPLKPGGTCCGTWTNFTDLVKTFYKWAAPRGKPLMIGETGAQEDPNQAQRKATWITDMRKDIKSTHPAIKAVVYFHAKATSNQGGTFDWRANTSTASFNAFRAMAQDPYFD